MDVIRRSPHSFNVGFEEQTLHCEVCGHEISRSVDHSGKPQREGANARSRSDRPRSLTAEFCAELFQQFPCAVLAPGDIFRAAEIDTLLGVSERRALAIRNKLHRDQRDG